MPTVFKVLGQSLPPANTWTALYTVPAVTQAVISTIVVCNVTSSPTTFAVRVVVSGGSTDNRTVLFQLPQIAGNQTVTLTAGITLGAADRIDVWSSVASAVSFNVFGQEVS